MTLRTFILSGLLLCGSAASGKDELSFKEMVVPVKVAPAQDSITAGVPLHQYFRRSRHHQQNQRLL